MWTIMESVKNTPKFSDHIGFTKIEVSIYLFIQTFKNVNSQFCHAWSWCEFLYWCTAVQCDRIDNIWCLVKMGIHTVHLIEHFRNVVSEFHSITTAFLLILWQCIRNRLINWYFCGIVTDPHRYVVNSHSRWTHHNGCLLWLRWWSRNWWSLWIVDIKFNFRLTARNYVDTSCFAFLVLWIIVAAGFSYIKLFGWRLLRCFNLFISEF